MTLAARPSVSDQAQGDHIMTSRPWRAAALLAPAAITAAVAVPAASASASSPSWQLVNEYASRPVCFTTAGGRVTWRSI
jgi:hypothetical protein